MISYLDIGFSRQPVIDYNISDLLYLIGFALVARRLQVENFDDSLAEKNVMASFNAFLKTQQLQELSHAGKRDIRIRVASEDLVEEFVCTSHSLRGR
jgi:hypothetical protein